MKAINYTLGKEKVFLKKIKNLKMPDFISADPKEAFQRVEEAVEKTIPEMREAVTINSFQPVYATPSALKLQAFRDLLN